jgi:hypothetical protein
MKMEKQFIRNVLDIEVNGFTGAVRYIVKSMYDVIHEDGFASIEQKNIEDVTMSRQEIKEEGGHQVIVEELKELYKIA